MSTPPPLATPGVTAPKVRKSGKSGPDGDADTATLQDLRSIGRRAGPPYATAAPRQVRARPKPCVARANARPAHRASQSRVGLILLSPTRQNFRTIPARLSGLHSEAQFKTLKYQPDFPTNFGCIEDARAYCADFFPWYNDEHHHSGLAMLTPADVHFDRIDACITARQSVMDAAFLAHPERFPHGRPVVKRPPSKVWINPPITPKAPPTVAVGDAEVRP